VFLFSVTCTVYQTHLEMQIIVLLLAPVGYVLTLAKFTPWSAKICKSITHSASLQPALARLLRQFRHCFGRDKTFAYLEKYILGLLSDVKRKSIEPIALAAGVAVRTLQEFLAFFRWDEDRAGHQLIRLVAHEHSSREAIGVPTATTSSAILRVDLSVQHSAIMGSPGPERSGNCKSYYDAPSNVGRLARGAGWNDRNRTS